MSKYTNTEEMPITIGVWLASKGDYDLDPDPDVISATSLQRPIRSLVLSQRVLSQEEVDIEVQVASKLGTATHNAIENAWKYDYKASLVALGYPTAMIDRIVINPDPDNLGEDQIPVYIEKRTEKLIDGMRVSGKFDFVFDGELHDVKTTKTFSYITGSNEADYRKQGSIYRWLNPGIISSDVLNIDYLFTDWSPLRAKADPDYPQRRCLTKRLPLFSLAETEGYIRQRLSILKQHMYEDQGSLPLCTPKELWQDLPKFAYYKNPNNRKKATKLFDLESDAQIRNAQDGGKGLIIKREGKAKRCYYCEAMDICSQAEQLKLKGLLEI